MSPEAPVQTVFACSQCGRPFAESDLVQISGNWVCADCKPAFLSLLMARGASPMARHYGGFWIRFGARFVDGLIFTIPVLVLAAVFIPNLLRAAKQAGNPAVTPPALAAFVFIPFFLIFLVVGACYEILMLKYYSATLGKMASGLKVIRPDGGTLSWGVCFGRFFMWNVVTSGIPYLNTLLMLVSSILLVSDDQKRALHDRVCDTRVIYKQGAA